MRFAVPLGERGGKEGWGPARGGDLAVGEHESGSSSRAGGSACPSAQAEGGLLGRRAGVLWGAFQFPEQFVQVH